MHKKQHLTLYSCTKYIYFSSANLAKAKEQYNEYLEKNLSLQRFFLTLLALQQVLV